MIILIAAAGANNELGKENDLLWHLPDDFKRFKNLTLHHDIIMGRKTFESLPNPLPERVHIVVTRNKNYSKKGIIVAHTLEEAVAKASTSENTYIIGGGEIYKLGLKIADKIELTRIHASFEDADTFFPEFSEKDWKLVKSVPHPADEKHRYAFTYETWVRKNNS